MLEYCCPPAQNGRACTDSSSGHGWVRCIPCNCYLITSTLQEHMSKAGHRSKAGLIGNVASKGLSKPGNPQPASFSQSSSSNLHSTPPENAATRSGTKASKGPEYKHCKPCGLTLHVNSWKDHTSGKKHLQKVASSGPPNASTPPQAPSPQVTPSNLPLTRPANASPLPGSSRHSTPTIGTSPLVSGSRDGGSRTKVAYCATTLQGETCTDSRCQYLHDVVRCEPCGRSYPSSLFNQHLSGRLHLDKVASNGPTDSSTSQRLLPSPPAPLIPQPTLPQTTPPHAPPIPQPTLPQTTPPHAPPILQPTPLQTTPPPSQAISGPSVTTADLLGRVIVSHEGGLDLIVEGTGPTTCPCFPVVNHNVSIEKTAEVSSLSVESMRLASSTGQCFSASLSGTTTVVKKKKPRTIVVSFKAPHAGTFRAVLKIHFSDKGRPSHEEFTVARELRGHATLPVEPASSGGSSGAVDESRNTVGSDLKGTGIFVSHDSGLQFSVECPRSHGPFATQTEKLVITKTSASPLVSFKAVGIRSSDDAVDTFSARLEGSSKWFVSNQHYSVIVSFAPQRGGLYKAILELSLCDHSRGVDFVVKRTLSGRAVQPTGGQGDKQNESEPNTGSQSISDRADGPTRLPPFVEEGLMDSDGTGISVSHAHGLDFGIVERKRANGPFATPSSLLTIKHAEGFPPVTFVKEKTRRLDGSDPEFEAVFEGDSINIQPGTESPVRVIFSPKFEGLFKATLEFVFYHNQLSAWFVTRRTLRGIAGSLEDHRHLGSLDQEDHDDSTEGHRELPSQKIVLLSPLERRRESRYIPDYELPPVVQQAVNNSTATRPYDKNAPNLISALRPGSLKIGTYAHYFAALLSVEDGHQQYASSGRWDVQCWPANGVSVQGRSKQYSVEIENDDEDLLPEVALGDFLWLDGAQDNIRYEARVINIEVFTRHRLAVLKTLVRLPTEFNYCQGAQFTLHLRHGRMTLRYQYHALTRSLTPPRRLLFPSLSDIRPKQHLSRSEIYNLKFRHLVNRRIRDDPQQLQAVVSALEQPKGSVPFIIYGPSGTGKTSTIVEIIVQLVRRDASVRVLTSTPSDAATDLLVERLAAAGLDSDKLYLLSASPTCEEDMAEHEPPFPRIPGHERLLAFRVVLSTCSKAAILQNLNIPVGHFSHIVIDDAAQAEEPLVMIPIMTFSNTHTNVILAGDPNQLSPAVKSPTAARSGLGTSYFERLMLRHGPYGLDTHVGKTIVALRRNWRSHGAIIAWPNRYLYEDMMRDYGNSYITYHMVHSEVLPKKGFPVVFHGVRGNEERAESSPSYFNVLEASIIRNYCVKLVGDPERKIYPEEIGVIAPYKTQVRAIRQLLKVAKLSDILVGSVEQFQGQERKVIVLATTRSNEESHPRKSLGLLVNRQRMNAAITRAQALLIVIGDPEVLGKYEHWRTFLKYVKSRKGWTGKIHDWESEEDVPPPGYDLIPRKGDVVYGDEFIDGMSEKIYRTSKDSQE